MTVSPITPLHRASLPAPAAPTRPAAGRAGTRPTVHLSRTTVGQVTAVLTLFPAESLPAGHDVERINAELQQFVRHLLRRPAGRPLPGSPNAVQSRRARDGSGPGSGTRSSVAVLRPHDPDLPRLDESRRAVAVEGTWVRLSDREFALIRHLERNRGRVVSRRELLDAVWGWDSATATRTVDVHVARLRRKLGDRASLLRTVVGAGYVYG